MKHKTLLNKSVLYAFLAITFSVSAISAQQVVSLAGNHHENGDMSISWTLGETVIETFNADEKILTQGFHQPTLTVVSIDDADMPRYNITAFPNPVKSYVTLSVEAEKHENMRFMLYDLNGNLIKKDGIYGKNTEVSFEGLTPALYFIRIIEENKSLTTIKIIKN